MRQRVAFFSVVPSPYQRDLFRALAKCPEVDLRVFYQENASPDSPWPEKPLEPFESVLPGRWFRCGTARVHWNWGLPNLGAYDVTVLNVLVPSITGQWLMRSKLRGKPWVYWGEKLGGGGAVKRWISAPLNGARAIAGIGSWAERDYRERFPTPRHYCIPYHCDLSGFLSLPCRPRVDGSTMTFLFCGQMIRRKGLDLLLEAFSRLPDKARLLLVGREAELPSLLEELRPAVRERIEYAGFRAPDALPKCFARADAFVLPSRYDGWGVVVNQALGAGLPVICSDQVGAGYDLVSAEQNGIVFRAGAVTELEDAMRRMIDEPELAATWGAASRNKALDYTPELGARKWVSVFNDVTAR